MAERQWFTPTSERIRTFGAMIAIVGSLAGGVSWAFDLLPFAKASDLAAVKIEVASIKTTLATVIIGQKETTELQLMERIDAIADRLQRITPEAPNYGELRIERVSTQQRLRQVQDELAKVKGSNP